MQKMKTGLMMFCLTVLLSCAALMMGTPTASAMTLADLQGDYRIVRSESAHTETNGSIISIQMENGELIARVKKPSSSVKWNPGDIFMKDTYVDNGKVHFQMLTGAGFYTSSFMVIHGNGSTLDLCWDSLPTNPIHEVHRI